METCLKESESNAEMVCISQSERSFRPLISLMPSRPLQLDPCSHNILCRHILTCTRTVHNIASAPDADMTLPLRHVSAKQEGCCPVHQHIQAVLGASQPGEICTTPCQEALQALQPDMLPLHVPKLNQCTAATYSKRYVKCRSH